MTIPKKNMFFVYHVVDSNAVYFMATPLKPQRKDGTLEMKKVQYSQHRQWGKLISQEEVTDYGR
jgi:hypothetical protein